MDSLTQVLMMFFLMGVYGLIGSIPIMIYIAAVTYIKKDTAYFRKKMDRFIGGY